MNIKIATIDDLEFLLINDRHINEKELINKINLGRIYIVELENKYIGWLRWGLFWDNIPFMNMLYVFSDYQKQGIGKKLVNFWEESMKKLNYKTVMTSTLSDEEAQHFYRKLAYKDSGVLLLEGEASEIIFIKNIQKN